ncbi:hypothetical protein E2C01_083047 [Portunus trituberculatus]|uniref:Uncharacterized protein n=1 Tax=Portunus trituberculatus TaxID=210409 RepID=A0A5B7J0W3_PORTR|nr:hypothetical protein [Portunus trituberculatus]
MENKSGEQSGGRDSKREQTGLTQEDLIDAESGDQPCTSKQPDLEQSGARERVETAGESRDGRLKYSCPTLAILPLARF